MEKVQPIKITKSIKVVIEPSYWAQPYGFGLLPEEEKVKWFTEWAKGIEDFFRDHRHQDVNHVYVDVEKETVCSGCGYEWETYEEDGQRHCYACGKQA